MDITLRDCGIGWLGLIYDDDRNEIYRTWSHLPTAEDALIKVQERIEIMAEESEEK